MLLAEIKCGVDHRLRRLGLCVRFVCFKDECIYQGKLKPVIRA